MLLIALSILTTISFGIYNLSLSVTILLSQFNTQYRYGSYRDFMPSSLLQEQAFLIPQFHGWIISHIRRRRWSTDISTGISPVCSSTAVFGDKTKLATSNL